MPVEYVPGIFDSNNLIQPVLINNQEQLPEAASIGWS
jgi:hypothetical protein